MSLRTTPLYQSTRQGGGNEGDSSAPAEVAGDTDEGEVAEGDQDQDEEVPNMFEEAEDAAEDAAAAVAAAVDEVESGSAGGSGSNGFFKPGLFKKRAKTGNRLCSWSWKEQRCEPADLCQYKYQASSSSCCCVSFCWCDGAVNRSMVGL